MDAYEKLRDELTEKVWAIASKLEPAEAVELVTEVMGEFVRGVREFTDEVKFTKRHRLVG